MIVDGDFNKKHLQFNEGAFLNELIAFERKVLLGFSECTKLSKFKKIVLSPKSVIVALRDENGIIIGYGIGSIRNFKIPSGHIYKLAVCQKHRRKGIATKLLKLLEEFFRKNSMKKIFAEVRESNKASLEFFKKNGYAEKAKMFAYYECLNQGIDLETGVKICKDLTC